MKSVLVLIASFGLVIGLYSPSDDVIDLTPANFQSRVIDSDDLWLVEFYAPWCGHCKSLAPEWKKAATALKGIVKIGAVDADAHGSLGGQYGVRGFPTIKIFGADKRSPSDYQGARSAQAITDAAVSHAKQMIQARLSGRGGGSSSGGGGQGSGGQGSGGQDSADPKDVVELTDSNFESTVLGSTDMWLIEFFAPWCGHCKTLAPHWAKAATQLKGKVKVGAVDATVHTSIASRFGVRGYPTIKYFPAGKKGFESVEEYDGGRTAESIVSWAEEKQSDMAEPPEVSQLTDQETMDACLEMQLCNIAFLPHILDSGAEGRNQYLNVLVEMASKYKKRPFAYLWSEAGAQMDLEEAVEVGGFGYPALVSVNKRKGKFATLKGSFSEDGVNEYLRELVYGRAATATLKGAALPAVARTEAWDGQDGQMPEEEDYDLSDVSLDDEEEAKDEL